MPIPPKGDPTRPAFVAASAMRLIGILTIVCWWMVVLLAMATRGTRMQPALIELLLPGLLGTLPGTLYIVFAVFLQRRQLWAIIASLALTSLHTLGMAVMMAAMCIALPASLGAIIAAGCLTVGLVLIIVNLVRSFRVLGQPAVRGFEPLLVKPLTPVTTETHEPKQP